MVWFLARPRLDSSRTRARARCLVACALVRALAHVSVGSRARVPCPRAWFWRVFGAYAGSYVLNNHKYRVIYEIFLYNIYIYDIYDIYDIYI